MKVTRRYGILLALAMALSLPSVATAMVGEGQMLGFPTPQTQVDSTATRSGTAYPTRADSIREWAAKVNGEEGQLQHRYLPQGDSLSQKDWKSSRAYNKFRLGLGTGYLGQYNKHQSSYSVPVYATLTYQFTPVHGLQGRLSYGEVERKNGYDVRTAGGDLSYFVNLSNYTCGYNPNRTVSLSAFIGIGGRGAGNNGKREIVPYGLVGADVNVRLGNNVSLSLQPFIGAIRDEQFLYKENSSSFYEFLYGVSGYLQLDFQRNKFSVGNRRFYSSRFFLETSQGVLFPLTNRDATSLGHAYTLALGYWPNHLLGVRLATQAQDFVWNKKETKKVMLEGQQIHTDYTTHQYGGYAGGRLELLLNPLTPSKKWEGGKASKFLDFNLSAGVEYGRIGKAGRGLVMHYTGVTTAGQLLYKVPHFDKSDRSLNAMLFIEPRYTWVFYHIPYTNTYNEQRNRERYFALSAGVRISRNVPGVADSKDVSRRDSAHNIFSLSWGSMHVLKRRFTTSGRYRLNNNLMGTIGREFSPWAGALLQVDYVMEHDYAQSAYSVEVSGTTKTYQGLWHIRYNHLTLRALYQLRLNSLMGYRRTKQRVVVNLLTGPVYTWNFEGKASLAKGELAGGLSPTLLTRNDKSQGSFGWAEALQLRLAVTRQWGIIVEPMLQVHFSDSFHRLYLYNRIGVSYAF